MTLVPGGGLGVGGVCFLVDDPAAAYAAKVKELEEELWSREQLAEELDALMTKLNPGQSRFYL